MLMQQPPPLCPLWSQEQPRPLPPSLASNPVLTAQPFFVLGAGPRRGVAARGRPAPRRLCGRVPRRAVCRLALAGARAQQGWARQWGRGAAGSNAPGCLGRVLQHLAGAPARRQRRLRRPVCQREGRSWAGCVTPGAGPLHNQPRWAEPGSQARCPRPPGPCSPPLPRPCKRRPPPRATSARG
jgi:hypothetical protein